MLMKQKEDITVDTEELRKEIVKINAECDNAQEASDCLLAYVKKDKELREYVLWYGCNRLIHDDRHRARSNPPTMRATNANKTTTSPRSSRASQLKASAIYTASYLDSYFVGNKRLGDCVRSDLGLQIGLHKGKIGGFQFEITFLRKVSKRLKDGKTIVRKVWSASGVRKLRDG